MFLKLLENRLSRENGITVPYIINTASALLPSMDRKKYHSGQSFFMEMESCLKMTALRKSVREQLVEIQVPILKAILMT